MKRLLPSTSQPKRQARDRGEKAMNTFTTTISFAMTIRTVRGGLLPLVAPLGRHINNWVAVALARRERQATKEALRHLTNRELKDIGLDRRDINAGLAAAARARMRRLR
jgi:uncharacterized protein YjiS (DUF1127 family)